MSTGYFGLSIGIHTSVLVWIFIRMKRDQNWINRTTDNECEERERLDGVRGLRRNEIEIKTIGLRLVLGSEFG